METVEHHRGDGGPMERSHMKDMVARNALESAAYHKMARNLDNQKKAFVRQNTRDEEEMKNLLHRLQIEQQTTYTDDESNSDDDNLDCLHGNDASKSKSLSNRRFDPECTANPYPVTIIPRFGAMSQPKHSFKHRIVLSRPGSSRGVYRRKSIEYEDIQDVLSSTNIGALSSTIELSSQASNTNILDGSKAIGDWLAHPDAISSVRRMRKSTLDQSHRKITRKLSNEQQYSSSEFSHSPSSSVSSSRSNSLKSRKRSNTISETASSPSKPSGISRRGGSLKERTSKSEDKPPRQFSLQELNSKKDLGSSRNLSDEASKIKRKSSKKQTLQRKLSNESTTMSPQTSRKPSIRRKQDVSSEECSPVGSPMVKDNWLKN